jgi:hypothetical protein
MKVRVQDGSEISLTQKDFLASGGEGQIYVIGGTTYKIYSDPSKMVPLGKIQELADIKDPHVIKPEKVLFDPKSNKPVGFTSRFVHNEGALCQIFTRSFRDRNNVSHKDIAELVDGLQSIVRNVHSAKSLIVDLNEMNFLLGTGLKDIYAIDVASYQTPHYKATALMESVRDRHMKPGEFTFGTDWFAFGILSFQMFVGIHPYKGKHPQIKGLEERMLQNVSVLHKDVGIPQTCYPISVIPKTYLEWYKAVFEKGERTSPPSDIQVVVVPVKMVTTMGSAALDIHEIAAFDGLIQGVWDNSLGSVLVVTDKGIYHNGRKILDSTESIKGVGFTKGGKPVFGGVHGFQDAVTKDKVDCGLSFGDLMSYNGTIYLKNGDKIVALDLLEVGEHSKVIAGTSVAANVLEHATKLFEGGAIQNLLGATYVSLFPTKGSHYQVRMPELDGRKILDAKFDGGVLMVLTAKNSTYDRLVFRFDENLSSYDTRVIADVTPAGLNFVTLDSGICVSLTEEEDLELFSAAKGSTKTRIVKDKALGGDMRLYKRAGKVVFTRGDKLFSLSLK